MCSPMIPPPFNYLTYMSTCATGPYQETVLDTRASSEMELSKFLKNSLNKTKYARWKIESCIETPTKFFLCFTGVCVVILLITMFYNQGGFKWLFLSQY